MGDKRTFPVGDSSTFRYENGFAAQGWGSVEAFLIIVLLWNNCLFYSSASSGGCSSSLLIWIAEYSLSAPLFT